MRPNSAGRYARCGDSPRATTRVNPTGLATTNQTVGEQQQEADLGGKHLAGRRRGCPQRAGGGDPARWVRRRIADPFSLFLNILSDLLVTILFQ